MDAKEREIQAFVRQCIQLRRLIQDSHGLTAEQYQFIRSQLETVMTDLSTNRKRRDVHKMA